MKIQEYYTHSSQVMSRFYGSVSKGHNARDIMLPLFLPFVREPHFIRRSFTYVEHPVPALWRWSLSSASLSCGLFPAVWWRVAIVLTILYISALGVVRSLARHTGQESR